MTTTLDRRVKMLEVNDVYLGDAADVMMQIEKESVALSIWSPPYHVGKEYEKEQSYEEWCEMLKKVIKCHFDVLKPGGFLAINIGDILVFKDDNMPKYQANNISLRRCNVTEEDVRNAKKEHPDFNRHQLAELLGCSEQTIQRRLEGNNIRGGKYQTQTRVKVVGGMLEEYALEAGLYLYDRRIWVKDPAWANCNWTSNSYRSVDEFEYLYVFWKPGETRVDRKRISQKEWGEWGSRAIWNIKSVQRNDDHEAKFPIELPRRAIRLFTDKGDIVLDCFMGSGTTALAAIEEDRKYIGIDIKQEYVSLSKKNIKEHTKQETLALAE